VRLFLAVYPPAEVVEHLSALVQTLAIGQPAEAGHSRRLARPETWHVTLAFLGEVPETKVPAACDALAHVPRPDLTVRVGGGGRFGRGRFTVVWAGLRGDVAALRELDAATRRAVRRAKLTHDEKPFKPHLTLARPGDRLPADELARDLAVLDAYEGPQWTVDEVRLMRSHLGPRPTYEVIATR
jgi:RNA 2',3'-cyclic 3'-phosphodiesterase